MRKELEKQKEQAHSASVSTKWAQNKLKAEGESHKVSLRGIVLKAESELILGLRPANERRRYQVTPSLIGWAQT